MHHRQRQRRRRSPLLPDTNTNTNTTRTTTAATCPPTRRSRRRQRNGPHTRGEAPNFPKPLVARNIVPSILFGMMMMTLLPRISVSSSGTTLGVRAVSIPPPRRVGGGARRRNGPAVALGAMTRQSSPTTNHRHGSPTPRQDHDHDFGRRRRQWNHHRRYSSSLRSTSSSSSSSSAPTTTTIKSTTTQGNLNPSTIYNDNNAEDEEEEAIYQQLKSLAADIRRYDDLYYNHRDDDDETGHHNNKMISDEAFDALVVREEQLCRAYPQLLQRLQVDEGLGRQTTRYGGRVGAIRVDRQHNKETTTDPSIAATATDATSTSTTTTTSNGNDRLQRRHGQKMMSLDNVVQREQLDAWMERVAKAVFGSSSSRKSQEEDPIQHETTASITILTEPKLDGLSLSLRYSPNSSDDDDDDDDDNDGWSLQWAATRGDGRVGQDVTWVVQANLDTFGIAEQLSLSSWNRSKRHDVEIRGEVVFPNSVFDNGPAAANFSNPRNAASGILLRKPPTPREASTVQEDEDSTSQLQRHLVFYAYDICTILEEADDDGTVATPQLWSGLEIRQILQENYFNVPGPFATTTLNLELNENDDALTWKEEDLSNLLGYHEKMALYREKQQKQHGKDTTTPPNHDGTKTDKDDWEWGDYAMDGCVHKVSDAPVRNRMGFTSRAPKWAVAHKFPAQAVVTRLLDVEVQVGRTGSLTPVAILEPVELDGILLQRATLHNFDHMRQVLLEEGGDGEGTDKPHIPVGSSVLVRRAGDVIPQVMQRVGFSDQVVSASSEEKYISLETPSSCPACGSPLEGSEQVIRCSGPQLECEPRAIGSLVYAFSRDALYVKGLSEKRIHQLRQEELLIMPGDLFMNATSDETNFVEKLSALDGWAQKSATNLVQSAKKVASEGVPFSKFLISLGIRFLGSGTSTLVARAYGTVDAFLAEVINVVNLEDPMEESFPTIREETDETKGIGPSLLESLTIFSQDPSLVESAQKLRRSIVVLDEKKRPNRNTDTEATNNNMDLPFSGMSIVFAGSLSGITQSKAQELAKQMGAKSTKGSVTSKTGLVVSGKRGGSKLEKALKLNIRIMTPQEFMEIAEAFEGEKPNLSQVTINDEGDNGQVDAGKELPFSDMAIVFTGSLPGMSRSEAQHQAEAMGAKSTKGLVTRKTELVVAGDKGGSKLQKALDLNITVMEGDEFVQIVKAFQEECQ